MANPTEPYFPSAGKVIERTGKTYEQWFAILDKFDVKQKGHTAAAAYLLREHKLPAWWSQNVVVEYERTRGLREVNQTTHGFSVSVGRTILCKPERAWEAFAVAENLDKWFTTGTKQEFREGGAYSNDDNDHGVFVRITAHRRIRFTWENAEHCPGSEVEVEFRACPDGRTVVVLTHWKLNNRDEVENMRRGWCWAMDSLRSFLEIGKGIRHEDWVPTTLSRRKRV